MNKYLKLVIKNEKKILLQENYFIENIHKIKSKIL